MPRKGEMGLMLCCGSHDLEGLAIPNDETTSNHFGTSGSSPPRSREGSLYKVKNNMSLKFNLRC